MNKLTLLLLLLSFLVMACETEPVILSPQQDLTQNASRPPGSDSTPETSDTSPSTPADAPIRLPINQTVTHSAQLSGVVKDQNTGLLLSEALIRIDSLAAISDGAGFFSVDALETGKVILIVQQPGYVPYTATIELSSGRNFHDIKLQAMSGNSPQVNTSAEPIILEEDGSILVPSPGSQPTVSPTTAPSSGASPTPAPSPSGAYDPQIDAIARAEVIMRRKENGIELVFLMQRVNQLPVNWAWGTIAVEYFMANTSVLAEDNTFFLTSGKTILTQNTDSFVVDPGNRTVGEEIEIDFTLTFPNGRELKANKIVTLSE